LLKKIIQKSDRVVGLKKILHDPLGNCESKPDLAKLCTRVPANTPTKVLSPFGKSWPSKLDSGGPTALPSSAMPSTQGSEKVSPLCSSQERRHNLGIFAMAFREHDQSNC
jgi:hypothetical protein